MTKFLDGPAADVVLGLRRAPLFLRVVFNKFARKEQWDALDQINDEPKAGEQIAVYRREKFEGHVHVCRRPRGGGYYAMAEYRLYEPQPDAAVVRDKDRWQAWCLAEVERTKESAK